MIGSVSMGRGFGGLTSYLLRGEDGRSPERVAWTAVRNLPTDDPELASRVMRATADQNARVRSPVYHLSLSAAPGESLTPEQWQQVTERVLRGLGLDEHQALIVAHRDTPNPHVHVMVNRVHPETLRVWKNSHDFVKIERSLRHLERELGLRQVPGRNYQLDGQERAGPTRDATRGERGEVARTGEGAWADRVRFQVARDFQQAKSWADLERRLASRKLRLERRGGGLVATDGRHRAKASSIHRASSYARLEERFGMSFEDWRAQRRELVEAIDRFQQAERQAQMLSGARSVTGRELLEARHAVAARSRARSAVHVNAQRLREAVGRLYHRDDAGQALRHLSRQARREGWARAAEDLAARPASYGRLRLGRLQQLRPTVRRQLKNDLHRVALLGRERPQLLNARALTGPPGFRALQQISRLAKILDANHRRAQQLQPRHLLRDVGLRAARIGVEAVQLVLAPTPWSVVRTATRLVRELGRGMER